MRPIEKLARDICWAEFTCTALGTTKARYWREMPAESRERHIQNARYWVAIAKKMKPVRLFTQVLEVIGAPGP